MIPMRTDQIRTDLPTALEQERRLRLVMERHIVSFITQHGFCNVACDRLLAILGGGAYVRQRMRWAYRWIAASDADRRRPETQVLIPESAA